MPIGDLSTAPVSLRPDGVKERRVDLGTVDARLVVFPAGFREPSRCRRGHTGYLVTGRALVHLDGVESVVEAGAVIHVKPGTDHRLSTEKGCTFLLFDPSDER